MPKILINERDFTSPGTSAAYSNYAILITGFMGTPEKGKHYVEPDINGVYELSSTQQFIDSIGYHAPSCIPTNLADTVSVPTSKHYGNQMAYELLSMGYPVLYKPITFENISGIASNDETGQIQNSLLITEEAFWEPFRDKASYDFRFITHGFLESVSEENLNTLIDKKTIVSNNLTYFDNMRSYARERAIADYEAKKSETEGEDTTGEDTTGEGTTGGTQIPNLDSETAEILYAMFESLKANTINTDYSDFLPSCSFVSAIFETDESTITDRKYVSAYNLFDTANAYLHQLETDLDHAYKHCIDASTIANVNKQIANLAAYCVSLDSSSNDNLSGRGDCIALIEIDEQAYTNIPASTQPESLIINAINENTYITPRNGQYCAMTIPSVTYHMNDYNWANQDKTHRVFDNNKKFPGAFHYLACFAHALNSNFKEWFATAGYTRGVSSYTIKHATIKLGEIAINALEPRKTDTNGPKFACNVIANFRGSYYLWGNRTAFPLQDDNLVASHFLNIRQLCITIKKQLYVACRKFTFDPNSDTLWVNFCNAIRPTLDAMKADQGIRDYKILKLEAAQKATLKARIRIIPIEAVEDFDLEISLEDSFGETTANTIEVQ